MLSFPGLIQGDDLPNLVKLLTSKNPDSDIAAMVALDGGYDPCDNTTLFGSRKQKNHRSYQALANTLNDYMMAKIVNKSGWSIGGGNTGSKYVQRHE